MSIGPVAPIVLLATAIYSLINAVKYLRARDWNGLLTLVGAVLAGWGAIALAAHSAATADLKLIDGGTALGLTDGGTQLLLGAVFGLAAGGIADFRKAIDSSDTSTKPPLIPSSTPSE